MTLGLVLIYCYEAVLDGLDGAILWLSIWFKSTVYKNFVISWNLLLSVKFTPPAKDNDLPKMKHGVDMMDYNEIFISHCNFENFFNLKQN